MVRPVGAHVNGQGVTIQSQVRPDLGVGWVENYAQLSMEVCGRPALVAQGIEHRFPNAKIVMSRA